MDYGNKMRILRERIGLTQIDMAEKLEISNSLYGRYEKEKQTIPLKHLNTCANIFEVSMDYIFSFTNEKSYKESKKELNTTLSGERIKEFRKENKLTQEKLAKLLNTTQSVIADYERGRYLIATPFLYTICKKYHISADYLLGKIDYPKYIEK